ncbi:hypothetical protein RB653_002449 [Dictyostelium firmibasis]|uniref:ABC transporter domain-containing protein n=1 Tax=Dictyostelium firmibasis TaxID=79012 RepID=A0AAN7YVM4_9MYCE
MEKDEKREFFTNSRSNSKSNNLNDSIDSKNVFGVDKISIPNLKQSIDGGGLNFSTTSSYIPSNLPKSSVFVSARNLSSTVGQGKDEKKILTDINFFLKPGSMVLLLGSPGCGKSSLMNTLALLTSNENITGNLLFNGRVGDPNTHHRHVSYVVQDDCHMAPLTVRDTFKFSADCQIGEKSEKERNEVVDNVLDFLDLKHVQNTVVGDEFLRGISGGQKKRVTIGVELVKDSNLLLMDEPTNGLDSSISLEMLTKIKNKVQQEKMSCLISLLQPGLEITKLFDYLMIMNQGQMSYFGPMNQAIGYFEGLGFKFPKHHNPAEFFQEIVDEPELYCGVDEESEDNDAIENDGSSSGGKSYSFKKNIMMVNNKIVPPLKGADEFAMAYRKSIVYKHILEYIDSHIPDEEESSKFTNYSLLKPYSVGFNTQLLLNVKRGFQLFLGNKASIRLRLLKNIVMGFVLGTLFWKMDTNQTDGSNRSGLLFFSLLSFVFGGFGSISVFFNQRQVFYTQRAWKYYNTTSYFLSMIITDLPMSIIEVLIFSNFVYWMTGLNKTWDRYIYFFLMCLICDVMSLSIIRGVCSFTPTSYVAAALSPAIVSPFILMCGFMKHSNQIPGWWIWLYWISPIHYGFEGLLLNEHSGLKYHCSDDELMPPSFLPTFNASYPVGFEGNQLCPITRGEQILDSIGFHTEFYYRWIDLAIIGGFTLFFWAVTVVCMKLLIFRVYRKDPVGIKKLKSNKTTTLIKINRNSTDSTTTNNSNYNKNTINNSNKNNNDDSDGEEMESVNVDIKSSGKANLKKDIPNGCYMQWKDLVYEVDVKKDGKKQRLRLLNGINGFVKPGMLVALMGPSGAGKSTLLDVLANRKTGGHIKGQILINGQERTKYFTRTSAYVEQMDILSPVSTVRESILFSAKTRLSHLIPMAEKLEFVDNILETLNLVKIQHSLVGDVESGLSLSQRKRVNMGIELASDPQLLFLDEPTSGLDSSAALKVMNLIKKIASSGRSIICTIHQPSTTIFKKFDHLLLLKRGGETVYFGPTGTNSQIVLNYFAERGLICDPLKNPADFILDATDDIIDIPTEEKNINDTSDSNNNSNDNNNNILVSSSFDPVESFKQSKENQKLLTTIEHSIMPEGTPVPVYHGQYSSSIRTQFIELMSRSWKGSIRRVDTIRTRIGRSFILALVIGTLFLRLDKEQDDVYNRVSLLFFSLMFGGMAGMSIIPTVSTERGVFYREQASGMYRVWIYYSTFVISDLPFVFITSYAYVIPVYFLTGLSLSGHGWAFFYHSFVSLMVYFNFSLTSIALASSLPIEEMAFLLNGILLSVTSLFAGFMIPPPSMPSAWKWLFYFDFISYPLKAFLVTEMKDMEFVCTDNKGAIPIPIPSQNTTKFFCPISRGTQVLDRVDYRVDYQYWDILIMASFTFILLISGYLSFKLIRYQNK